MRSGISIDGDKCVVSSIEPVESILLYDASGKLLGMEFDKNVISLASARTGVHVIVVEYSDGMTEYHKIMR